ncbi:IPT/TIG domain-containing protein [Candidatus Poribacteria bacterium]|nr:IPT/TIG domain-containing protein [Candidatus Poribacteria bacterium]
MCYVGHSPTSPPPTVERSLPIFVPLVRSGKITILGTGFIRTPTVQIGGITARSVEFISADELNVLTPPGLALGPQDVVVVNPDGQRAVLPGGVTVLAPIKLKSVEPTSGGLAGGTRITIIGEPTVEFGGRTYPSRFVEGGRGGNRRGERDPCDRRIRARYHSSHPAQHARAQGCQSGQPRRQ